MVSILTCLILAAALGDATPIDVTKTRPIEGLVVDGSGQPISGAEIVLAPPLGEPILWQGRSDAQGRFQADRSRAFDPSVPCLISPDLDLVAYKPGWALGGTRTTLRQESSARDPVRIVLSATKGIPVHVFDPDAKPVANAKVRVTRIRALFLPASLCDRLAVTTDVDGKARITCCLPEDATSCEVLAPGFGIQEIPLSFESRGERILGLGRSGRLRGRVVDPEGRPIPKAVVSGIPGFSIWVHEDGATDALIRPEWGYGKFRASTDASGRFDGPALANRRVYLRCELPSPTLALPGSVAAVVGSDQSAEITITAKRAVLVRGVVRERSSRRPIAGASISLASSPGQGFARVRTDASGQYETAIAPGALTFRLIDAGEYCLADGRQAALTSIRESLDAIALPPVELVRAITVRGIVVDDLGHAVASGKVEVRDQSGGLSQWSPITRPSADGASGFVLGGVRPGASLELSAFSGDAVSDAPVRVVANTAEPITMVASERNTLSLGGRVLDRYGKPLAGARITIHARRVPALAGRAAWWYSLDERIGALVTGADGRFQTPRRLLRNEEFQIVAQAAGMQTRKGEWFASTTPSFFDLMLEPLSDPRELEVWREYETGLAASRRDDVKNATARFEGVLRNADQLGINDPLNRALWITSLAEALAQSERFDEARELARRALALREGALGPNHPYVADSLALLARQCRTVGRTIEAELYYRKSLAVRERVQGTNHPQYAREQAELANVEIGLDLYRDAAAAASHAITVLENTFGRESTDLLRPLDSRSLALTMLDRDAETEPDLRRAIRIAEREYESGRSPNLSLCYLMRSLAAVLVRTRRFDEAMKLQERADSLPMWHRQGVPAPGARAAEPST